jgi:DNA-binding transcriptional LysR family regulator
MDLRVLRYFVAVAERLSFTEGARFLGIAQPPLSVQIRNLEKELGGLLFDRDRRKISLTPLGTLLFEEAQDLLQRAGETESRLRDAAEGRSGEIRLGYTKSALSEKITRRIRKYLRKNRGVRLILEERSLETRLHSPGPVDAEIIESLAPVSGGIVLEKAAPRVALPPKHRLAERTEVSLSDLIGETLLLPPISQCSPLEKGFLKLIEAQPVKIDVSRRSSDFSDRLWRVSLGLGVTICSSADRPIHDAVVLPLLEPSLETLIQCLPSPNTKAVALPLFLDAIRE